MRDTSKPPAVLAWGAAVLAGCTPAVDVGGFLGDAGGDDTSGLDARIPGALSGAADAAAAACIPDQVIDCVGFGGCPSRQTCNAAGSAYGPCVCAGSDGGVDGSPETSAGDSGGDCEHTCQGYCANGRCVIAIPVPGGRNLAINATSVYWTWGNTVTTSLDGGGYVPTDKGYVMRTTLSLVGAGPPTTLASLSGGGLAWGLALDATSVFWTMVTGENSPSRVMKMPLAGGTPVTLASGQNGAFGIVVDSTYAYWASPGDGTVMKVPIGGGAPFTLAAFQSFPANVAVDATSVYWTNAGDDQSSTPNGAVMKVPLVGGPPVVLASALTGADSIAVDATSVYFTAVDPNIAGDVVVRKVPLGGGSSVTLASGLNALGGLAIDATSLYYGAIIGTPADGMPTDNALMKVPLGGGTPTLLASTANGPGCIAVDATSVYWTDGSFVFKATPK
jgi:hypothetical protein